MDIPSGSSPLPTAQRSLTTDAVKTVTAVAQGDSPDTAPVVRAVVVSSEPVPAPVQTPSAAAARPPAVTPDAARTLMTVVVNSAHYSPALPEFSAIDDTVLTLARQGKPFSMQLQTALAIPEGSHLLMKLSPAGAALLDGRSVAQLPLDVRNALAHALVRQVNPVALLQQLMALSPDTLRGMKADTERAARSDGAASPTSARKAHAAGTAGAPMVSPRPSSRDSGITQSPPTKTDTLPGLLERLQALVPDLEEVLEGDGIGRFLRSSGLFFESGLARNAGNIPRGNSPDTSAGGADSPGPASEVTDDFKSLLLRLEAELSMPSRGQGERRSSAPLLSVLLDTLMSKQATTNDPANTPQTEKSAAQHGKSASRHTAPPVNPSTGGLAAPGPATVTNATAASGTSNAQALRSEPGTPVAEPSPDASVEPDVPRTSTPPSAGTLQRGVTHAQEGTSAPPASAAGKPPPAHRPHGSSPPPSPAARSAPGLALSQYQRVQDISPKSPGPAATTSPATSAPPLPVPGLELPLPLRIPPRRNAASREELAADLLQTTRDTLARTTLHQLASTGVLQDETATPRQAISFDLPVLVNGQVQVFNTRIEHEDVYPKGEESTPDKDKRKEKLWTVSLGFDIEGLGPMFCQLSLVTRDARLQIWAENPSTRHLAETHREALEKGMAHFGVNLREVACHEGMPKQVKTQLTQSLVDIST